MNVISLGWNCDPAIITTQLGLRPRKTDGYKTCPFDLMMSSHDGVALCLYEGFRNFFDIEVISGEIVNNRYGFVFNHESEYQFGTPLAQKELWGSPTHYTENDFHRFRQRYEPRIESFREYVSQGTVIFVHQGAGFQSIEIDEVLSRKYPNLKYAIVDLVRHNRQIEDEFLARFGSSALAYDNEFAQLGNCFAYNSSSMDGLPRLFSEIEERIK